MSLEWCGEFGHTDMIPFLRPFVNGNPQIDFKRGEKSSGTRVPLIFILLFRLGQFSASQALATARLSPACSIMEEYYFTHSGFVNADLLLKTVCMICSKLCHSTRSERCFSTREATSLSALIPVPRPFDIRLCQWVTSIG